MDGEAWVITFGSLGTDDDRFAAPSVGTGSGVGADTGAGSGAEHSNTESPRAEPSAQAVRFVFPGDFTHPNPYDALCDGDGETEGDGDMADKVDEVDEKQLERRTRCVCVGRCGEGGQHRRRRTWFVCAGLSGSGGREWWTREWVGSPGRRTSVVLSGGRGLVVAGAVTRIGVAERKNAVSHRATRGGSDADACFDARGDG